MATTSQTLNSFKQTEKRMSKDSMLAFDPIYSLPLAFFGSEILWPWTLVAFKSESFEGLAINQQ